jgi:hypothetical protein
MPSLAQPAPTFHSPSLFPRSPRSSPPGQIVPSPAQCQSWPSGHCHYLSMVPPAMAVIARAHRPALCYPSPTRWSQPRARSSQTAHGALPVPVPTRHHTVLGEDFRAKEQNRGVIKEIKMNPQQNRNESPIRLEIRFRTKSRTPTTSFPIK